MFSALLLTCLLVAHSAALAPTLSPAAVSFLEAICDPAQTNIAVFAHTWCNDFSSESVCGPDDWEGITCTLNKRNLDGIVINFPGVVGTWPADEFRELTENTLAGLAIIGAELYGDIDAGALMAQRGTLRAITLLETPMRIDVPQAMNILGDTLTGLSLVSAGAHGDVSTLVDQVCTISPNLEIFQVKFAELAGEFAADAFDSCQFGVLRVIDLRNNALRGDVPLGICLIASLTYLDLSRNYFTNVDVCFQSVDDATLVYCDLSRNAVCEAHTDLAAFFPCIVDSKPRAELDECGVCNGDSSSCIDCRGVRDGSAVVDACGVCEGDESSCSDCTGTLHGTTVVDECGVCGGDNSTCVDCLGVPNGVACYDLCDVCAGDSLSCVDCDGVLFGTVTADDCGVCGGDSTSCLDCAGTLHGTLCYDVCDVCGGDGSSCTDCTGRVVGEGEERVDYDSCGVCGGDNSSCDATHIVTGDRDFMNWAWIFLVIGGGVVLLCGCFAMSRSRTSGNSGSKRKKNGRK